MSRGTKRTLIPATDADLSTWPVPDVNVFNQSEQEKYLRRRRAVELYACGESFMRILALTTLGSDEVRRLVKRCVIVAGDGRIYGFYALLPRIRLHGYRRTAPVNHVAGTGSGGCAGALTHLLQRYPDLQELIDGLYSKRREKNAVHEARISLRALHNRFKKYLRSRGFTDHDWPFNTANCGYAALGKYCNDLRATDGEKYVLARSGQDAARRGRVGTGHRRLIQSLRPYSFVQLDFHKIDAASVIILRNSHGKELPIPISRWHVGLLVEERLGPIIGAYIALERTPSGDSVLEVVESALRPAEFETDDARVKFVDDGNVLIIQFFPQLAYQCFSALKVDNAWSNAAHEVVNNIIDTVGCAVNFGPVRAWWRRPLIEKINGELTQRGLQRLPSTHGSGSVDTRVDDPNRKAIEFRITLSELIAVLYASIRSLNTESSERLQWTSPVAAVQNAISNPASGFFYQPLPKTTQDHPFLMMHIEEVTVRGDLQKNVRPYFKLGRATHTNPRLASSYWLIGKKLITYTDRRKCRIVHATIKETGEYLGLMEPSGPWANIDCSWRDRALMNRSGFAGRCHDVNADPLEAWGQEKAKALMQRKRSRAKHSSSDALQVANVVSRTKADKIGLAPTPRDSSPTANPESPPRGGDAFGLSVTPDMTPISRRK